MIVALLALFVSLSGVSYGVATGFIDSREIKNNEVRSVDIRNNQIRTRDLRNNEVRGIDIRNSTVRGRDIALNTVTGEDVNESTLQKVPSAMLADSATSADAVGGVKMQRNRIPGRRRLAEADHPLTRRPHDHRRVQDRSGDGARGEPVGERSRTRSSPRITGPGRTSTSTPGDDVTATFAGEAIRSGTVAFAGSDGSIVTVDALGDRARERDPRNSTDDCGFFGTASAN